MTNPPQPHPTPAPPGMTHSVKHSEEGHKFKSSATSKDRSRQKMHSKGELPKVVKIVLQLLDK